MPLIVVADIRRDIFSIIKNGINLLKVLKELELLDKIRGAVYLTAPLFGGIMKIDNLTLEEKVGQMLMFAFNGTTYNKQIDTFINEFKLGGVIYFNESNSLLINVTYTIFY